MSLLSVKNLTHTYGEKILYKDASFELYKGEHMGVVGMNGAGKSTLIKILCGNVVPDDGIIKWQSNIKIGILDQYAEIKEDYTVYEYLKTSFKYLYEIEEKLNALYTEMAVNQEDSIMKRAASYQDMLEEESFYDLDSIIKKISYGLGINALGFDSILKNLSGGQRAKVILAKLLLEKPDILLLDEPTNFLDKEHVQYLSEYLSEFKGAFIIVSHDLEFLDKITTCICDIEYKNIRKFNGNYSSFLKQREHLQEDYARRYAEQQKTIEKLETYIAKNKVRAATAKIARGRQKQLEKIERMDAPSYNKIKPFIKFNYEESSCQTALKIRNLVVGYGNPLLPQMNFSIKNGEKVVITGFNGIGKSTLLKTIIGEIDSLGGCISFGYNIIPGYYEQDLKWKDSEMTPLEIISDAYPEMPVKEVRKHLSQCAVKNDTAMQKINTLSGGEQSKVKLCLLTLTRCNLLILDEVTNHMDSETKEALKESLISYEGTVILVSHESSFYDGWSDRIINIEKML